MSLQERQSQHQASKDDPYFSDPNGFLNNSFFGSTETIQEQICTCLNDRATHHNTLESSMNLLISALQNSPRALSDFLKILDTVRAQGNVEMVMRKEDKHLYHSEAHSAEISIDTKREVAAMKDQSIGKRIISELASSAAAWHDVVQDKTPPNNELESANAFVREIKKKLDKFDRDYPDLQEAMTAFKNELEFISRELIVYDTWLIVGKDKNETIFSKTLLHHARQAEIQLGITFEPGPYMKMILEAAHIIETNDTRRFGNTDVQSERFILSSLAALNSDLTPLNKFFSDFKLSDNDKEVFLGLMGQNIRMFPELNLPYEHGTMPTSHSSTLTHDEHREFVTLLNTLKFDTNLSSDTSNEFKKQFDLFFKTKNIKMVNNQIIEGDNNIIREQHFAKAQQHEPWISHAGLLQKFADFYEGLNDTDKNKMGFAMLIAASRFQPGMHYLKNDTLFLQALSEAHKEIGLKLQPHYSPTLFHSGSTHQNTPSAHLLKAKENLEACMKQFGLLSSEVPKPSNKIT